MTTRLETKVEDGVTYVKIKGQGGAWGRPVVDDQGNFYRSLRVAADAMNMSVASMRDAIESSEPRSNRTFSYASSAETSKALSNTALNSSVGLFSPHTADVNGKPPFCGVRWPDGSVTVRLTNTTWSMSRKTETDLPAEVLAACTWL